MLHKWKFILSNWINCYFNDTKTEECITVNSLLTIISHLHKNLNLDESKSSTLEARNIEEFILEKYPEFKLGNGTVEPSNEEELYVVASLLLLFVCVNSKDVDIKQAMCSRLSPDDQETIMKFSKSLMECSPVTYIDVQAAITEACGEDLPASEKGRSVAETPPALRSLHGEVRRLQAALDAERFDRNYLQEELSRTNLRMEKLLKDKEQLKLEIVNLKAKISMCCGQEAETKSCSESDESSAQLNKQLQQLEQRLVDTQGQLDDAQDERDTYKAKIDELKRERDKWLYVSQEEASRASQLGEELEAERRRVVSLQELVSELRQHHQNNRLDGSQLECDDPDATIHSLHNASVCSEACVNVIEVQLGEEKAKVDLLKQQIQTLQDNLATLTEKTESEKLALENILTVKNNDISDLKHRINDEIQEKINLKTHFNEEISKLKNDISELEQKLIENQENSSLTIERKMLEIQTLQEEKISLLQSLSDETTKQENVIKNLRIEIDTEKNLKVQMREDYEHRLMKLNEKVLNRNNELVELQNKVFEKGEMMEKLNMDLKKEKELNHELSNRHNDEITKFNGEKLLIENKLQQKSDEAKELQKRLLQNVAIFDELNREIDDLKAANNDLLQGYKSLEETKKSLQVEIQQRDSDVEGIRKEIENITNIFSEEKDKFMFNLEEKNATINALQVRLQDEIKYKIGLEKELHHLHQGKIILHEEVSKLSIELANFRKDILEKDRMIYALELYLKEERHTNLVLKDDNEKLNKEIVKLSAEFSENIKSFEEKLENENLIYKENLCKKEEDIEYINNKLLSEMEEKEALQLLLMSVNEEKEIINKDLIDRCSELEKLQEDYDKLCNASEQNVKVIEALGNKIDNETKKYLQLEIDFDTHTSSLIAKLSETERTVKEISSKSRLQMEDRELQIQTLQIQVENLNKTIEANGEVLEIAFREKEALIHKLEEELSFKNNIEKEYQTQCAMLNNLSSQLNGEIAQKSAEINYLKYEIESLLSKANEKGEELKVMENKLMQENEASSQLAYQKNQEIKQLKSNIEELQGLNDEFDQELKKEIASKTQAIDALQRENEQLHYTIEEDNSNHEVILKEKDVMIESLEEHVKVLTISLESLRKDYEDSTFTWEKIKIEMKDKLENKDHDILELKEQIEKLKLSLEQARVAMEHLTEDINKKTEIMKKKVEIEAELHQNIKVHVTEIAQYEIKVKDLENYKENLETDLDKGNATKVLLEAEKAELLKQNAGLLEELYQEQMTSNSILTENKKYAEQLLKLQQEIQTLSDAKLIIEQELSEKKVVEIGLLEDKQRLIKEKNILTRQLQTIEEDKETILAEKQITEQELTEKEFEIESVLEEKKNLTQQLEVIGLVKQAHTSEKQAIEQQLLEKQLIATDLLKDRNQLLSEKEKLSQELASSEESKQNMLIENQTIEQQLKAEKNTVTMLLAEKEQLLKENESLLVQLDSENQTKQNMLEDLATKEETIQVLVDEKEQLLVAIGNLSEQLESVEKEKQVLLSQTETIAQQLNESETHQKTILEEKEALQIERDDLAKTLESLSAEKQAIEKSLQQEIAEKNIISEEKESLTQQVVLIKQENENLLEDKQITSEKLVKEIAEKDMIIEKKERISQQLDEKTIAEADLLAEKQQIEQELENVKVKTQNEKQELISLNRALEDALEKETTSKTELLEVKEYLSKQVELLENEKIELLTEREIIENDLKEEMTQIEQKFYKEQAEKQILQQQVTEELETKNALLEVKEYLSRQLIEEKSAKEVLEQEKETLQEDLKCAHQKLIEEIERKSKLEEERHYLLHEKNEFIETRNQEISSLNEIIEEKKLEISDINNTLKEATSIKELLNEEKLSLLSEIGSLKHNNIELNAIKDILAHDKDVLNVKKEELIHSLTEEKASRDEVENEKNAISFTLEELKEKYALEIKDKLDQISNITTELTQVKMDFKRHEDIIVHIGTVVNSGLDNLFQNINKENIDNKVLQNLINIENNETTPLSDKCSLLINIADTLFTELALKRNLEKDLEQKSNARLSTVKELKEMIKEKEMQVLGLQSEVKNLQKDFQENQNELIKQTESYNTALDCKIRDIQTLQMENKSLNNELNDVKVQLDVKVHSLKEKLVDNENLTEKLKKTYECQIENLNVMVTKLTSYLKEKTYELDMLRKEKEKLQQAVDENNKVIHSLEEEVKTQKLNQEKLINDFESERQVLKNMVTVTESIMEDQKVGFNKAIVDYEKTIESYQSEKKNLQQQLTNEQKKTEELVQEKQCAFDAVFKELTELRKEREDVVKELESNVENLNKEIVSLKDQIAAHKSATELLEVQNKVMRKEKDQLENDLEIEKETLLKEIKFLKEEIKKKTVSVTSLQAHNEFSSVTVNKLKDDLLCLQEKHSEFKIKKESLESELLDRIEKISKVLIADTSKNDKFKYSLQEKLQAKSTVLDKMKVLTDEVIDLVNEKNEYISKLDETEAKAEARDIKAKEEIERWKDENSRLANMIEENKVVISDLEQQVKREAKQITDLREDCAHDRLTFENRFSLLQEYQNKAEKHLQERDKEITSLKNRIKTEANLEQAIENLKEEMSKKDTMIAEIAQVKDEVIDTLNKELINEKANREKYQQELESKTADVYRLRQKLEEIKSEMGVLEALKKEHKDMGKDSGTVGHRDTSAVSQEKTSLNRFMELRDRHQVSTPTSDLTHSSMESFKTITDLEKIIHDKNRTITTLQSDLSYMKSLMADSENKLLDITKELEISKENCEQLSVQLKKSVHQKNEEIAELKKQVSKMSVTENRASQIIKLSAKYQAIILKRIVEIKSNTILKELTNFGNTANCDSELKRNLNSGAITMEDLENFLETTDKHLKRCSDKQLALQKERDRLIEVNRINESEIINMKKFLTELSVSFKTFNSIKDLYTQKLSRVVSMQRTVRREILSLDGQISDSVMCKLERSYTAVMQDLCECSMNLERWVERSIARTISSEKIKQAFTSDTERASLASITFQNASLEVQLEELENSFQKLLEEAVRASKGEGAKDVQAATVMEVRAEYEDKLNRMKAKMKQLYQDQIQVFKDKQKEETAHLERELAKTREKLAESSRAYEEHIKALTTELWQVGEKFLMKKDEAEWLRKKQKSGSLMSLQHLHSTGLTTNHGEMPTTPSDSHSLRSLPVAQGPPPRERKKREGRGLHMSDEEGEVFDNRWLKELQTPRRESNTGQRLSELRWRNSLCPPHLKSSYPAETQFANTLEEEDIKCVGAPSLGGRGQRKEVGITAYKKPGPPTPSKQAGRLSATDSELRESLRAEPEPAPRKTSTPSRIRALFRSARNDTGDLPESEYPICEQSEYPKCDSETPKCDIETTKCDIETTKCDIKTPKRDIETPKCDNESPKCDIETPVCDSETNKHDSDNPKCDSENQKNVSEFQKSDWFKLNLRQRAALWEPLAKE